MTQAYSSPDRENDPHALPDIEVFYAEVGELAIEDCLQDEPNEAGWYCLPDSDPIGPFATAAKALANAQDLD